MEVVVDPLLRKRNRNDRIQTEFMCCLLWVTKVNLRQKKFGTRSSSSSSVDDSRLCKIYNEYETCNMRREGPVGQAGFESMFVDWKTCALRVGLGMFYFQGGKAAACLFAAVFASLRAV